MNRWSTDRGSSTTLTLVYVLWLPMLWWLLKDVGGISDRYLPHPVDVGKVFVKQDLEIFSNAVITLSRILLSYVAACVVAVYFGALLYRHKPLADASMPALQAMRAVPAPAMVPFFLLWFGFSETGKLLIIVAGIAFNLVIAVFQILRGMKEKYLVAFNGFGFRQSDLPLPFLMRFALESLLPTLRFSLTVAIGLSVLAEYLGAQSGLGYLIQSARSTYALDVLVACAIVYGLITVALDNATMWIWRRLVPWGGGARAFS